MRQETIVDEIAGRMSAVSHEKLLLAYKTDVSSLTLRHITVREDKEKQTSLSHMLLRS